MWETSILGFSHPSFITRLYLKEASTFYKREELSSSLIIRDEYPLPIIVKEYYYRLLADPISTVRIIKEQILAIVEYEDIVQNYSLEALMDSHEI